MRYCVFSPSRPEHFHICESRDGLDEFLSHDQTGGKDWLPDDRVVGDDGQAGTISYDGSIYEFRPSGERVGVERVREALAAYLQACGWKREKFAAAVESAKDLFAMEEVVKRFPPRVGAARFAPGCFLVLVIAGVLAGTLWATHHFWGWPKFGGGSASGGRPAAGEP